MLGLELNHINKNVPVMMLPKHLPPFAPLTNNWDGIWGVRNLLRNNDKKHGEGHEDGYSERHLLTTLGRKEKRHKQHKGQHDAR